MRAPSLIPGTLAALALVAGCVDMANPTPCPPVPTAASVATTTSSATGTGTETPVVPAEPTVAVPSPDIPLTSKADTDQLPLTKILWQTFIAINWPAETKAGRGIPKDPTNTAVYKDMSGPRVWETWKQNWETSGTLSDWNSYDADPKKIPCQYVVDKDGKRTQVTRENWPALYKDVGGGTVLTNFNTLKPSPDQKGEFPFVQAGPLIDVNNKYVGFEIRFNRELYDCVKDGKGAGCARDPGTITLPASDETNHGAITLKASWRKMTPDMEAFKSVFRVRDMLVLGWEKVPGAKATSSPVCRVESRALTGVHVVLKDKYIAEGAKEPIPNRWFWATFEQSSNTVPCNPLPWSAVKAMPYGFLPANGFSEELPLLKPAPFPTPDPNRHLMVCRVNPFQGVVEVENKEFQPRLKDYPPWSNYQMVANQWFVSGGFGPPSGVANVTLEPYAQTDSCATCHSGEAAKTDFVWSLDLSKTHREKLANDLDVSQ